MYSMVPQGHSWRPFSNPAPLGNSGFAVATFVSSLHTGAIGIASGAPPNIVVGLALFYGGIAQVIAGAWSFASNSAFGAIVFTSYGCYWMSYAAILIPGFGISDALSTVGDTVRAQSLGIFYLVWSIQTFIFLLGSSRSNWGTFILLLFLFIENILTCIGYWSQNVSVIHASGYMGMFTSFVAWYNVAADMLTKVTFYCDLPNPEIGVRAMGLEALKPAMHTPLFHDVFQPHITSKLDGRTPGNHFDFVSPIPHPAHNNDSNTVTFAPNTNNAPSSNINNYDREIVTATQEASILGGCARSQSISHHDVTTFNNV
ncbi:hypothetical protein IW140_005980 [Coemansia sp. RSA 1813]|nr:hypothetical protein EV178_003098 [Coemansia sp. RSA 1646]KAJ1767297.1 hypothetical protein LPJ74_005447 [Coemansia sp. RSA 1843]KAJ2089442.1 hypothetical protein IW138_003472 [Coemansia sp. RSA 986]KAJ2214922.1 hypothetical protein EV179_002597 [Coemansia sp. RSA 487]KAJ2563807.1 hypothetical protein IW140_005980 [Coemansia sp. RSA 1813]